MKRCLLLCAFAAVAVTLGCFGFTLFPPDARGDDDDDDDDDDDSADNDDFELLIDNAEQRLRIDGYAPSVGEFFVLLELTFNNPEGRGPVSTSPALLSLENEGGLIVTNAISFSTENGCETSVSVAGGGSVSCSIAFANDVTAVPVHTKTGQFQLLGCPQDRTSIQGFGSHPFPVRAGFAIPTECSSGSSSRSPPCA